VVKTYHPTSCKDPCMFNFSHTAELQIMADWCFVESRGAITRPCGSTTWERFFPPTFGMRNWYMMRPDRLSQGLPRPKMTGGVSWLRNG
jgi:hypothetical protein